MFNGPRTGKALSCYLKHLLHYFVERGAHVVEFFEVTRVAYDILCSCRYYN